jgi:hypothetical protein
MPSLLRSFAHGDVDFLKEVAQQILPFESKRNRAI